MDLASAQRLVKLACDFLLLFSGVFLAFAGLWQWRSRSARRGFVCRQVKILGFLEGPRASVFPLIELPGAPSPIAVRQARRDWGAQTGDLLWVVYRQGDYGSVLPADGRGKRLYGATLLVFSFLCILFASYRLAV